MAAKWQESHFGRAAKRARRVSTMDGANQPTTPKSNSRRVLGTGQKRLLNAMLNGI